MPKANPTPSKPSAQPNTLNGLAGWVEVFRAGTHTDSQGKRHTFTQADLDQMASNHALGAAPAVLGHPQHDDPAYAWVDGYKREAGSLFAKFADINPAFAAGVESGAYRNRSVSIYKDGDHGWRVRHVGWLGAKPPAIDGLKSVEYAAPEADCIEFSAPGYSLVWGIESLAKLLRGLREQMIAKEGIEAADAALPQWQIDSALESATAARQEFQEAASVDADDPSPSLYSQTNPGGVMSFTQEQLDAAAAKARKEAEDKSAADFAAKDAELIRLRGERQTERIVGQITGWKAKGLVTPAEESGLAEFMVSLENSTGGEFAFSASDKTEVKKTPAQFFADFMATRKPQVLLASQRGAGGSEDGGAQVDGNNSAQLADAARSYMSEQAGKGLTVSLPEAVAHVAAKASV